MSHTLKVAIVQLDVTPDPTSDRLARAEGLITQAAQAGARLIALPEVFNTGYRYVDDNFQRAETLDEQTVTWMKTIAARLNIHLAGSILLRDGGDIYNALLLVAPDGRLWRYDKHYPWGWERAYFRAGRGVQIAHTDLGDIGLLICWDVAHPDLWRQYAGAVDFMLVSSCPPDLGNPTYEFPDGAHWSLDQMGALMRTVKGTAQRVFGDGIDRHAAWLSVPAINTVASGHFSSPVPNPRATLLMMLPVVPQLAPYLRQADRAQVSCAMTPACKIVTSAGAIVTQLDPAQGETFAVGEIELANEKPRPIGSQPGPTASWFTYLTSDVILPLVSRPIYQRGIHALRGEPPAPRVTPGRMVVAIAAGVLIGFLIAALLKSRRKT